MKFELQGFRTIERPDIQISAAFVATVGARMEVGTLAESITVTSESPIVDTRSNIQQTVMSQEILEGIPTGRDPWSLAKLIPGVQVATYDVGGTQSMQQSSMSAHGSNTADVSYNIDGATVNWPGGGGGATMIYYDQGSVGLPRKFGLTACVAACCDVSPNVSRARVQVRKCREGRRAGEHAADTPSPAGPHGTGP